MPSKQEEKEEDIVDVNISEEVIIEKKEKPQALQSKTVYIQEQNFKIQFGMDVSSNTSQEGQIIYLKAAQELFSQGHLLVEFGAPVQAKIVKLSRKKMGKFI